jgi:uncharacterized 2Fe-2S/4Fe-4S cluster protein (DUF4445 family)
MTEPLRICTPAGETVIYPDHRTDPAGLADLLARKGLALNTRCNQRGLCRGCTVVLESGPLRDRNTGQECTTPGELIGCRHEWVPGQPATITLPARSLLAHRPAVADDFEVRVPVGNEPLFAGELGVAIDIGTTTVVALVADLASGRILARASGFNQQIRFGDDVLTRIQLCHSDAGMVPKLQEAICRDTVLPLVRQACERAGVAPARLGGMSVAGNATMLHLLFGIDPSPMGLAPFTPRFIEHRVESTRKLGLPELPDLPVHALPGFAAYVGADIAAGVFATGLHYESEPTLFVDVGTNGEIVLRQGERLYACATAAGPAFEGCGLTSGMRATEGAIETVAITRGPLALHLETIGAQPVAQSPGICGSGYVDFLAQGRSSELLTETGRFDPEVIAEAPHLFQASEFGQALRLCGAENNVRITEPDVALLLQAKAAIAAGIETLLARESLAPSDIRRVYLAGGFGMHLDVAHAIACGLLPGFDRAQVEAVGNTSLAGAYLAMLDRNVLDEIDRIRWQAEIIELNLDPHFEDRFVENMMLP